MTKPIRPEEITRANEKSIPAVVIEAFNELIIENFINTKATVKQIDVVNRIIDKAPLITREQIYKNGWLNVDNIFRDAGWNVKYDKPGYNESYEAYWKFEK